jgi:hypothetical protein
MAMATTIGLSVVLDHSQVSWTQPEIQTQPQGLRLKSLVTCHSNILIKRYKKWKYLYLFLVFYLNTNHSSLDSDELTKQSEKKNAQQTQQNPRCVQ